MTDVWRFFLEAQEARGWAITRGTFVFSSGARAVESVRSGGMRATTEGAGDGEVGFTTVGDFVTQAEAARALGKNCVALEWGNFNKPTEHAGRGVLHEFEASVVWVIEGLNDAREGLS